jgi:GH15 family glucan-1,4-alpha-glucosidase
MTAPVTSRPPAPVAEFQPIADYGLLADCTSAALVSRAGSVDWLCLPHYDSPAVFARLLDPAAGHWSITPTGAFEVTRRYLPGTLVTETTFTTATGSVRLLDALAFRPGQRGHDLGREAPHELLRLVEGVAGEVELALELAPRPEYGLVRPLFRAEADGGRTFGGPNRVSLRAGVPVELDDEATMAATFVASEGRRIGFSLRWAAPDDARPQATEPAQVADRIDDVAEGWRSWEAEHDVYAGPNRERVQLSARVLKGLTYRPTGAIVAAPTAGLPETEGGERNWDYRYAWVRDASLTVQALHLGACSDEADEFVSFMTSSAGGRVDDKLQIMYGIDGRHDLAERELPHLRGWRDSRPVRVGNGAWDQTQLDVYGELLDAIHLTQDRLGELHPEIQRFVADLADAAARRWIEADAGMWEMRGEPQHHLSSKVLCWVALDRAIKLAPKLGEHRAKAERWLVERERIRDAILERGWSERRGAYAQALDSDELDAAVLLMPLVGFLEARDPRMRSTIDAVARDLTEGGLVLRYRNQEGVNADGLVGEEGTFVLCSFWLVSCLAQAGELDRAQALFDQLAGYANDLGLLAEEVETATGELLGNFPQAFSHIGLIVAAAQLDDARTRRE